MSEEHLATSEPMTTSRLEAFSDGVMAVIITIMVLELKTPIGNNLHALRPIIPNFLVYALSFQLIGTYWNNHHHLLHRAREVNGAIMWANLNLLFWLSLIPFFTQWLGANYKAHWPTASYAVLLLAAAFSYMILQLTIIASMGRDSKLAQSIGSDRKGKLSLAGYALALVFAFMNHWVSDALFVAVAIIWFIPDRRLRDL